MGRLASLIISSSLVSLVTGAARATDSAAAGNAAPASASTSANSAPAASAPGPATPPAPASPPVAAGAPSAVDMLVEHERATVRTFYGWEILISGEAGGALSALSLLLPDRAFGTVAGTAGFIIGAPVYVLGGPVAHWSHDDFTKGLVSLGANVAIPLTAGLIGRAARCAGDGGELCESRGFFTGFALGLVTVPLLDAFILGWEHLPVEDSATSAVRARKNAQRAENARFNLAPGLHVGPRGEIQMGVAGRF